ncbi:MULTISPECIES: type III secretion system needle complex protein [Providencia]|uniref:type III secretion system needle complex protein n=1 Tax=Providencia TaxID=586 RepID=UPI0003E1ED7F|nr:MULTISPECIES: type III secretion system needle complex protein [Providencia]ETT01152.1 type III secretion apparatus needle protein [Providencia alcalifaciens PAL-3]EUC99172.1 type III secretion apparatus needle protein [Providencia alcalifaciens PAL-1]MTC22213.1 type III secretion system needle complex protein [Providencia sp. wls1938]HEF8786472.1 type III secretion system needle complex protein [Providencia alcalifaciens]
MLLNNIWSGYLDDVSLTFDKGVNDLQKQIDEALAELAKRPSDPALLAQYQSKLSEYNLYRNAQSNTVKVFKDIDAAIIQNFR